MLLLSLGVALYVLMAMVVVHHHGKLLDVVTDWAGIFALGCGLLAVAGLTMMVVDLAHGRFGYLWPTVVLSAALIYAPANVVLFIATLMVDRFAVFGEPYLVSAVLLAPAVMLFALVIVAGFLSRLGWFTLLGFIIWIESVALAHLWVIAAASASI
ncbi:hypothetical protein [Bremerella sp. P1]|uniref:hypothetical protein n=1 Tax=Bremerella sp. P1 TaxID=3026424 RepID=UPI0023678AD8|nr:hypothetical protein [Bremerella sp. P1]WDI42160.1 hypothetical protein PSR63_27285 [Bremerella sp. P1]